MKWLVRMEIDTEIAHAQKVQDSYGWHKKFWDCFPGEPDTKRDFLTRIDPLEGAFRLWVLANREPKRPVWCPKECYSLKKIAESFLSHRYYAFDLRANPVKAMVRREAKGKPIYKANGKRKAGKRVPLVNPDELRQWLIRKGEVRCRNPDGEDVPGGFRIMEERPLEISPMVENHFRKPGQVAFHGGVQFRGVLEVTNRSHFVETYLAGIGSAKSFGFGLLLLAPVNL